MKNVSKFLSLNRNSIILGILLVALPVLLILSQTQQIFNSQAGPNDPAITLTRLNPTSGGEDGSAAKPYRQGQAINAIVTFDFTKTGHYDAVVVTEAVCNNPNVASFIDVGLRGQTNPSPSFTLPTFLSDGKYCFVVNAHKIDVAGHSGNHDWDPAFNDLGCGWDGKTYVTGLTPGQIVPNGTCDASNSKVMFNVGSVAVSPSPSSSPSVVASASPAVSPAVSATPNTPASPIAPRPPRSTAPLPAELAASCIRTDFDCLAKDPIQFTGALYTIGLGLVGGVGILFMIIGSYLVLASQGDPTKVAKGKEFITYSIIGLLLALFGYAFYQIIAVDILELPGFSK